MNNENTNEAGANVPASSVPAEEWREVENTQGIYQISSHGRLWSKPRPGSTGGFLVPDASSRYPKYRLCVGGRQVRRRVHLIVTEAFLGPKPPGQIVRHLNGDRLDNSLANLAYGTHSENAEDGLRLGELPVGEESYGAKLTDDRVLFARSSSISSSILAPRWGVHEETLNKARRGVSWRHLPMSN